MEPHSDSGPDTDLPDDPYQLVEVAVDDLRRYAARLMSDRKGLTLEPTDIVGLAIAKILKKDWAELASDPKRMFYAYMNVVKSEFIDYLRRRQADKRGGGRARVSIEKMDQVIAPLEDAGVVPLDLLDELTELDERQRHIVVARVFTGLTNEEIAVQLGVSETTVRNEMNQAMDTLYRRLSDNDA